MPDYPNPKDFPNFFANYGPRGVLDCKATDVDDTTVDPRFGKVGKQTIKDTGPLTKKRMETCDDDFAERSVDFLKRQKAAGKPVFLWVNFTHMHLRTHTKPESIGQSGRWQSPYHDTMIAVGYQTAIAESRRSRVTSALAISFSLVIALIAALDHPMNRFISIPQQPLMSLQLEMKNTPEPEAVKNP